MQNTVGLIRSAMCIFYALLLSAWQQNLFDRLIFRVPIFRLFILILVFFFFVFSTKGGVAHTMGTTTITALTRATLLLRITLTYIYIYNVHMYIRRLNKKLLITFETAQQNEQELNFICKLLAALAAQMSKLNGQQISIEDAKKSENICLTKHLLLWLGKIFRNTGEISFYLKNRFFGRKSN